MSSKKKRVIQSKVTLHNFFNAGSSSSAKESGKTRTPAKSTHPKPPELDIIVIDSDSDDEPVEIIRTLKVTSSKKRRRLSESSGEVEFVDPAPLRRKTIAGIVEEPQKAGDREGKDIQHKLSDSSSAPTLNHPTENVLGYPSSSHLTSPLKESSKTTVASFGTPSLLLINSTTTKTNPTSTSRTLSFGAPFLLRPRDTQPQSSLSHVSCPSADNRDPSYNDEESPGETDFSTVVNDDWGMGDDENELLRSLGDEVEDDFEELRVNTSRNSSGPISVADSEVLLRCLLCDRSLEGWSQSVSSSLVLYHNDPVKARYQELQTHINECLDSTHPPTSATKSSPTAVAKELRPLTSLPPPQVQGPLKLISCDGKTEPSGNNAFNMMMSSHKENEAWKEASVAEDRNFRATKGNGGRRKAPFYKVLQGMPIAVDAFRYGSIPGVTAYFLTHAHSDHYTSLSSTWKSGPIYCSEGTANLIIHMLSVDRKWVHPLPMDTPTVIPDTKGVSVTLIEANHCPGSCLFYFEGPQTINAGDSAFQSPWIGSSKIFKYLHCGDFRASPRHILHPELRGKTIDHVYLDTTYLDPKYSFPPQPLVISACAELARRLSTGQSHQNTPTVDSWLTSGDRTSGGSKPKLKPLKLLVVVGTYSIGKERIVKAIAQALKTKVYCDARKAAILRCQADRELNDLLTSNPLDANVHIVPLGLITSDKLKAYVERFKGQFTKAVGFRPTGWTYTQPAGSEQLPLISSILSRPQHTDFTYANLRPARNSTATLQLYPIPYSEHSSFYELTCFAMSFEWGKMIATVNVGSETSRGKMGKWVAKWEAERKRKGKVEIVPHRHPDYW